MFLEYVFFCFSTMVKNACINSVIQRIDCKRWSICNIIVITGLTNYLKDHETRSVNLYTSFEKYPNTSPKVICSQTQITKIIENFANHHFEYEHEQMDIIWQHFWSGISHGFNGKMYQFEKLLIVSDIIKSIPSYQFCYSRMKIFLVD